jgi:hypothetical protein
MLTRSSIITQVICISRSFSLVATAKIVSFFSFFFKKNKQYTEREREQLYPFSLLLGNVIEVTSIRVYIYIQWPKIFFPFKKKK